MDTLVEDMFDVALEATDLSTVTELFGFGQKKLEPVYSKAADIKDGIHKRYLTIHEALDVFKEASDTAVSKFKKTAAYAKAVAAKGNAAINAKINSVINAKKHEMVNKLVKGIAKAVIVAALLAALTAIIVIPGAGIAAAIAAT